MVRVERATVPLDLHQSIPGIAQTQQCVAALDDVLATGFVGGRYQPLIETLDRIFAGTPLAPLIAEHGPPLARGEVQEQHFLALAAARVALHGAQYDALRRQVCAALGRAAGEDDAPTQPAEPDPLLNGVRHWLMELAITGFARLEASNVLPFLPTLTQLRQLPQHAELAYGLTGFVDELLERVPIARPDDLPLLRWGDLWSTAMCGAAGRATTPEAQPVSGTLYPLGVSLRARDQFASIAFCALLTHAQGTAFVRLTRSRFKVGAINGAAIWLLFPDTAPLLDALSQGLALDVRDMPLLPGGDLLWDASKAAPGAKARLLDVAARHLAPHSSDAAVIPPAPPLHRHPVQLAEPIALADYAIQEDGVRLADGTTLPLDARWDPDGDLDRDALSTAETLFGLLRYDAGRWALEPLSVATKAGKLAFAGQSGAKLFKKPPKLNPVAVLEERASRLLRRTRP
jgi:hypothetical protein